MCNVQDESTGGCKGLLCGRAVQLLMHSWGRSTGLLSIGQCSEDGVRRFKLLYSSLLRFAVCWVP
jgi:hypothetical protein